MTLLIDKDKKNALGYHDNGINARGILCYSIFYSAAFEEEKAKYTLKKAILKLLKEFILPHFCSWLS